ncbi:MAG: hypothetical protein ACK5JM_13495 [Rhodoblastus sp.]
MFGADTLGADVFGADALGAGALGADVFGADVCGAGAEIAAGEGTTGSFGGGVKTLGGGADGDNWPGVVCASAGAPASVVAMAKASPRDFARDPGLVREQDFVRV